MAVFWRAAVAAESLYDFSKKQGVTIVASDLPDLFSHEENPASRFLRRIICAYNELEKDMTVSRLQHGLANKKKKARAALRNGNKSVKLSQKGVVKVNGSKSILETVQSKKCITQLKNICQAA